jgi:hypothetical protein
LGEPGGACHSLCRGAEKALVRVQSAVTESPGLNICDFIREKVVFAGAYMDQRDKPIIISWVGKTSERLESGTFPR